MMAKYLYESQQILFPDGLILLILDTYAAHRSAEVRAVARDLGIELIFIRPECTDRV
jgi:transposase